MINDWQRGRLPFYAVPPEHPRGPKPARDAAVSGTSVSAGAAAAASAAANGAGMVAPNGDALPASITAPVQDLKRVGRHELLQDEEDPDEIGKHGAQQEEDDDEDEEDAEDDASDDDSEERGAGEDDSVDPENGNEEAEEEAEEPLSTANGARVAARALGKKRARPVPTDEPTLASRGRAGPKGELISVAAMYGVKQRKGKPSAAATSAKPAAPDALAPPAKKKQRRDSQTAAANLNAKPANGAGRPTGSSASGRANPGGINRKDEPAFEDFDV